MTFSYWQQTARAATAPYDVVVIGGGIIGCSVAYWLSQHRPGLRVAIVEAHTLGAGASGRNAGFMLQGTDTDYLSDIERYGERTARRLWHFTRESRELIEAELTGEAFDLVTQGSLTVADTEEQDERLRKSVAPMRGAGAPVVYLEPSETNRRLRANGFRGSLYVTSGAMLNPLRLVRHIAAQSGADVLEHHPVQHLSRSGDRVTVETPARQLEAGHVVLALGAYLPELVPALGSYVRPVRAQMLATEATEDVLQVPAYTHDGEFYIRQAPDGTVLLGGARHRHAEAEVGYDDRTTPAVQADLERYLHTHFPWAQSLGVRYRWSGTMGFSPDGLPVVGPLPDLPGSVWATGFTGHGMSYGFRFGRLLADLLLGESNPDGYSLFAASRFDTEELHSTSSASAA